MRYVTLFAAIVLAFCESASAQAIKDGVSREFTTFNDLLGAGVRDGISREFTVLNNLSGAVIRDGVSREFTVMNDLMPPPTNGISRAFTVQNDLSVPNAIHDAVGREFTTRNTFLCLGNLTDDGLVTLPDLPPFIGVMLGRLTHPFLIQAADMNCDGFADGQDIQLFVNALLGY